MRALPPVDGPRGRRGSVLMAAKSVALLTYVDLAVRYGVPVGTVRQWVNRGKLPPPDVRVGQSPAWFASSLDGVKITDLRSSD